MTPRILFNIILKIFGLFFLREIITAIPTTVSAFVGYFSSLEMGTALASLIISVLILAFYVFLVLQLVFKTNKFIDYLKLDQGFNEHELSFEQKDVLQIGLSASTILTIALIVIGGLLLTEEIPEFCRFVYLYSDQKGVRYESSFDMSLIVFSAAKTIIGLLILGERKRIVDFIEERKPAEEDETD